MQFLLKWEIVEFQNNINDVLDFNVNSKFGRKIVILIQNEGCKIH